MCSVVGYVGSGSSSSVVLEGLKRLEYRGYDSAGIACISKSNGHIVYQRAEGQLVNLTNKLDREPIDGPIGIGHTRWATHGVATERNAHPQFDCDRLIAVVHNGIIENYHELKQQVIAAGHTVVSDTDTELISHLFEDAMHLKELKPMVLDVLTRIHGAYALIVMNEMFPNTLIAIRKGSPMCIGMGPDNKIVASDVLAFAGAVDSVMYMPDESFAIVHADAVELYDFSGKALPLKVQDLNIVWANDGKQGYEHFMLKEIHEQKTTIHATIAFFRSLDTKIWDHCGLEAADIKELKSISFVGSGTSWHAARIAQFFFESIAQIPTRVMLSSEFRYMPFFKEEKSMHIFVSQSGETADTLEALRMVNGSSNSHTLAFTNVASSTMVREAQGFLLTHAGPEVAVASTKAFTTQLAGLYWLAHRIALERGLCTPEQFEQMYADIFLCAEVLENTIEKYAQDIELLHAPYYEKFTKFIFLGRHISYPFAMEAALKLKEISYIFSQCYPAGELKHGPIALIDHDVPVVLFSCLDEVVYKKLLSNAQEVKARGGHLMVFAFEGQVELTDIADCSFVFPRVNPLLAPLAMTGVMQFFVYQIAKLRGCPIDKPRNLAKSVTVE